MGSLDTSYEDNSGKYEDEISLQEYLTFEEISSLLSKHIGGALMILNNGEYDFEKIVSEQSPKVADIFCMQAQDELGENFSRVTEVSYPGYEGRYISLTYTTPSGGEKEFVFDLVLYHGENSQYTTDGEIGTLQKLKTQESLGFQEALTRFQQCLDVLESTISSGEEMVRDGIYSGNTIDEMRYIAKKLFQELSIREVQFLSQNIPGANDFLGLQKRYLSMLLGIQKERPERYTDILQKSKEETDSLIHGIIQGQSIEDSFDFLVGTHALIDENDYQDGTLQKNYAYFVDTFYEVLFEKIKSSVSSTDQGGTGERKGDIMLYHRLASLASGRKNNEEDLSMDSRLYRPDFSEKVLFEAMKVQCDMMDHLNEKMKIDDEVLKGKKPRQVIDQVCVSLETTLMFPGRPDEREVNGKKILERDLKVPKNILELPANISYTELSFEDKVTISTLARLIEKLKPTDQYSELEGIQKPKKGQEFVQWVPGGMSGGPGYTQVVMRNKAQRVDGKLLVKYMSESITESAEFLGGELDSRLDMTFGEKAFDFLDTIYGFASPARDVMLREEDEILLGMGIDPNSQESEFLRLYNDLRGNGGVFEFADGTNDMLKTAGYMAAIIAGSMMLGGSILLAARLGGYAINSLIAEGAIYGVSSSVVSWGIDAAMGDATGYASNGEAMMGIGTDIVTAGATGMLGGVLAKRFGKEGAKFLQEGYMTNKMIFAGDLAFLGVGTEAARLKGMDAIYHNSEIFTPENQQIIPKIFQKTSYPQ